MKQTHYRWILFDKDDLPIRMGLLNGCVDIQTEDIFPKDNSTCDRCLYQMQEYADKKFPEEEYTFIYEETEINFEDMIEKYNAQ